ncbi:hypothetical protein NPIL_616311, partial [Nephila pilipes]
MIRKFEETGYTRDQFRSGHHPVSVEIVAKLHYAIGDGH